MPQRISVTDWQAGYEAFADLGEKPKENGRRQIFRWLACQEKLGNISRTEALLLLEKRIAQRQNVYLSKINTESACEALSQL